MTGRQILSSSIACLLTAHPGEASWCGGLLNGATLSWRPFQERAKTDVDRHPELVTHVFSICTPYSPPHKDYVSTEDLAKGPLPQFAYQLHLASGDVGKSVNDEQSIRQLLKAIYGGKGPNGEYGFDSRKGVLVENLPAIGESKLLNGKVSLGAFASPFILPAAYTSKRVWGVWPPKRKTNRHRTTLPARYVYA